MNAVHLVESVDDSAAGLSNDTARRCELVPAVMPLLVGQAN